MALTDNAPYAPTASVVKVLDTYRLTGLGGGAFTTQTLARMSMGDEITRRVLAGLRQLELLDDENKPSKVLEAFKKASTSEYKGVLANQIRNMYAEVFAVVPDPSNASLDEVTDAFRTFKPDSLRGRMVTLFLGLCEYSGITTESPARKQSAAKPAAKPPKKDGKPAGSTGKPAGKGDLPPTTSTRDRYVEMLMKRAEESESVEPELLDRIERALGIAPKGEP